MHDILHRWQMGEAPWAFAGEALLRFLSIWFYCWCGD